MKQSKIVWLLSLTFMICGQDDQLFLQGNDLFEKKQYHQASTVYESIRDQGFPVLFNLALSYLHDQNLVSALVVIQRAEKEGNFQELTQLYELSDCIQRQIDPDFQLSLYEQLVIFWKKCILSFPILWLQLLVCIMLLSLIIFWYKRWYSIDTSKIISIMFLCMFLSVVWWSKYHFMEQKNGIVAAEHAFLYAGPDLSFYKKDTLHQTDLVTIVDKKDHYYQVKCKQKIGWIDANDIELV